MSTGTKIPRNVAERLANHVIEVLRPFCDRIAIAGSLRQLKSQVGDIEIVAIPKISRDLYGAPVHDAGAITVALAGQGYKFIKNGDLYKKIDLRVCTCDLFLTTPEKWGVIYMLRTGDADFSRLLVTQRRLGGWLPSYLKVTEGRIMNKTKALDTREEEDVFRIIGIPWTPPEFRNAAFLNGLRKNYMSSNFSSLTQGD